MSTKVNSSDTELVESIQLLHEIATPVSVIARRLHMNDSVVRHVIQTGSLPKRPLNLVWKTSPRA